MIVHGGIVPGAISRWVIVQGGIVLFPKIVTLYKKLYFFIKSLKSKEKKPARTSFYYVSQGIWLGNSKRFV